MPAENPIADAGVGGCVEVSACPTDSRVRVGMLAGRFRWVICGLLFLGVTKKGEHQIPVVNVVPPKVMLNQMQSMIPLLIDPIWWFNLCWIPGGRVRGRHWWHA